MKKLFIFFAAVVLTAISANSFAQGSQQTAVINATRNYWVNSADYATAPTGDAATNIYGWSVYLWNGIADYTLDTWTATAATSGTNYSGATDTDYNTQITWLTTGTYVVEVIEESTDGCTTVRRFGVTVIDLDLLVVTKDNDGTTLTAAGEYCNTNSGNIWGDSHDDNLNSESLATMTMTYEITLYTAKGGDAATEIGTALPAAGWKFSAQDASTIPSSPGSVAWTVTDATGTYTTGSLNEITVAAGTSTVTITAEIQNIAADAANKYVLGFSVDPATVLVENGGTAGDYAEGVEPGDYNGVTDTDSHINSAYTITVNPAPNTTKIKFD